MSDTYTVSPQPVNPGTNQSVTVSYKSPTIVNGTNYTLKSSSGTQLGGTQAASRRANTTTGSINAKIIASDNSGKIFIACNPVGTGLIWYNAANVLQTAISIPNNYLYSITTKNVSTNTIYWANNNIVSLFNCNTMTFTTTYTHNLNLASLSYSSNNGFLYGTSNTANVYNIYKINPADGSYSTIFVENGGGVSSLPGGQFFRACAIDDDGYIYCANSGNGGSIYKFAPDGTYISNFAYTGAVSNGYMTSLTYNPADKKLYAMYDNYFVIVSVSMTGTSTLVYQDATANYGNQYPFFDTFNSTALIVSNSASNYAYTAYSIYATLTYSFLSTSITFTDYTAQLYNGATPFGVPITLNISCFLQGTRILRFRAGKEEYVAVESLKKGDLIKTSKSGYKSITLIGQREFYNSPKSDTKNRLYRYRTAVCPELLEDLVITGEHCALVNVVSDEKLREIAEYMGDIYVAEGDYRVPAHLDERAVPYDKEGPMVVWHFALENENKHENYGVFANGLLVESSSEQYLNEYSGMKMIE